MIELKPSKERGYTDKGFLKSYHSFSFGDYVAPNNVRFSVMTVINDDMFDGGAGFDMHPHKDMEIVTYMVSGSLRHQDSMGNGNLLKAGNVQRITAGTGIKHSEVNADEHTPLHLLQIWIMPALKGLNPSYEEKHFSFEKRANRWAEIISNHDDDAIKINQDVRMLATNLDKGESLTSDLYEQRCHYIHIVRGAVMFGQNVLKNGDALLLTNEQAIDFTAQEDTEMLWFDLPSYN